MSNFLLVGQAARWLQLGPDRIRQMARSGVLPAITLPGGTRLFRERDVKRLARLRRVRRESIAAARKKTK